MLTLSKELVLEHIGKDGLDKFLPENNKSSFTLLDVKTIKDCLENKDYDIKTVRFYDGTPLSADSMQFGMLCMNEDKTIYKAKEYPIGQMPSSPVIIGNITKTRRVELLTNTDSIIMGKLTESLNVRHVYTGQSEIIETKSTIYSRFKDNSINHIILEKTYETELIFENRKAVSTKPVYTLLIHMPAVLIGEC